MRNIINERRLSLRDDVELPPTPECPVLNHPWVAGVVALVLVVIWIALVRLV